MKYLPIIADVFTFSLSPLIQRVVIVFIGIRTVRLSLDSSFVSLQEKLLTISLPLLTLLIVPILIKGFREYSDKKIEEYKLEEFQQSTGLLILKLLLITLMNFLLLHFFNPSTSYSFTIQATLIAICFVLCRKFEELRTEFVAFCITFISFVFYLFLLCLFTKVVNFEPEYIFLLIAISRIYSNQCLNLIRKDWDLKQKDDKRNQIDELKT